MLLRIIFEELANFFNSITRSETQPRTISPIFLFHKHTFSSLRINIPLQYLRSCPLAETNEKDQILMVYVCVCVCVCLFVVHFVSERADSILYY